MTRSLRWTLSLGALALSATLCLGCSDGSGGGGGFVPAASSGGGGSGSGGGFGAPAPGTPLPNNGVAVPSTHPVGALTGDPDDLVSPQISSLVAAAIQRGENDEPLDIQ